MEVDSIFKTTFDDIEEAKKEFFLILSQLNDEEFIDNDNYLDIVTSVNYYVYFYLLKIKYLISLNHNNNLRELDNIINNKLANCDFFIDENIVKYVSENLEEDFGSQTDISNCYSEQDVCNAIMGCFISINDYIDYEYNEMSDLEKKRNRLSIRDIRKKKYIN